MRGNVAIGYGSVSTSLTPLLPSLVKLVLRGTVFARMAPDQKTQLVEILQSVE